MIGFLTNNPVTRLIKKVGELIRVALSNFGARGDRRGLAFKIAMGILALGLCLIFYNTLSEYQHSGEVLKGTGEVPDLAQLPSIFPVIWQSLGAVLAIVAFVVSLFLKATHPSDLRQRIIVISLWIAAAAAVVAWLPTDILATRQEFSGKALGGERPSVPAYLGGLFFISVLILSVPAAAMIYFRLGIMDRYTVHSFLSPFAFTLFSMIAIWVIADLTDNGEMFGAMTLPKVLWFYVVQVPHVILFVMPIVMLLAGLSALSKMSKSNELISMIGAGRSVLRVLTPLFIVGAYASLICLAFKYEWAPSSVGYKEAIEETAIKEISAKRKGVAIREDVWARRGWMHVNDVDRRTWFVGRVPFRLSDDMADVIVWQLRENNEPKTVWKARRARWIAEESPPVWKLFGVTVYEYDENRIPRITTSPETEITGWSETPWKLLSSSQNPEHLGLPGLQMYLDANKDRDTRLLAPFRTNWWYIFAEPMTCLVMILVAAPLGIVYSRRGVMGGVTSAIAIFAFMYVMRGTVLALGHKGAMSPFWAAWSTNIVVGVIGLLLLWFRAQNRETPKLRNLFRKQKRPNSDQNESKTSDSDLVPGLEA